MTRFAKALFGQVGDQVDQVDQVGQGQGQELDNMYKHFFIIRLKSNLLESPLTEQDVNIINFLLDMMAT